ncbi:MAG: hypothetical protein WC343_03020, partial [Bacilli bacterium]
MFVGTSIYHDYPLPNFPEIPEIPQKKTRYIHPPPYLATMDTDIHSPEPALLSPDDLLNGEVGE